MKSFEVPDEVAPLVEMLLEIHEHDGDGRVWAYTADSVKAMLHVLHVHQAEARGGPFVVEEKFSYSGTPLERENIAVLPIGIRAHNALFSPSDPVRHPPIRTVAELIRYSAPDIRARPGIGSKAFKIIREALAARGLTLPPRRSMT